jgi:hypothetical protein
MANIVIACGIACKIRTGMISREKITFSTCALPESMIRHQAVSRRINMPAKTKS